MYTTTDLTNGDAALVGKRQRLFEQLESPDTIPRFFDGVAEDVSWTLHGKHPLAGEYRTKRSFLTLVVDRLRPMMRNDLQFRIRRLHVGDTVVVAEMESGSVGVAGDPYDQFYVWICTFDGDVIVEVHAYVDSVVVNEFLRRNEPVS
ncbi:nuclear transport factor 2 family protein [Actinopolyspora mortivallis]|uniref:Ketosteroid isomerase n=1 Tax=Actinopolyspora mortivallis TaxID=33906 RepID=A0A2T0GY04_ACTMO|nr:ketosteroid isomerase [Actinopolyspora mortivallis]PRW63995.1 ketosteroid isomerase [Actinopolyspora mortivallis]